MNKQQKSSGVDSVATSPSTPCTPRVAMLSPTIAALSSTQPISKSTKFTTNTILNSTLPNAITDSHDHKIAGVKEKQQILMSSFSNSTSNATLRSSDDEIRDPSYATQGALQSHASNTSSQVSHFPPELLSPLPDFVKQDRKSPLKLTEEYLQPVERISSIDISHQNNISFTKHPHFDSAFGMSPRLCDHYV